MSEKLTQKCNSSIAHIRNSLLCQRLFYHFPYFCPQKNISKGIMNKKLIITALCLSAMTPMMAQNITGKVMDMKGEPLAFANVVLLNRTDSAFVKGAVSGEDGSIKVFGRGEPIIYINATLYNYRKLTVKSYKKSLLL